MHFLVHVPCDVKDLMAVAKVSGLLHLFTAKPGDNGPPKPEDVAPNFAGPDGGKLGTMLAWLSPGNSLMHCDMDQQIWTPSVAKDENGKPYYWVGFWKDKMPTESDLRRTYTQSGPLVKFGNQSWKLPTPDTVDSRAVYADDGSMRWEVIRQFSWVCDEAQALRQQYLDEFGLRDMVFRVDPSQQIGWLLKLLQINYRILPEVAIALDMWIGKDHIIDTVLSTLGLSRKGASDG